MNIVTVKRGASVDPGGTATLSQLFPPDTYGLSLKHIDVIIPAGHTFTFRNAAINGWNFTGEKVDIVSGAGDSHVYRITCTNENEAGTVQATWLNNEVTWKPNQFLYFIGYY